MKPDRKQYSRLLISNPTIVFLNFVPTIQFLSNLVPKFQSALLKMKLGTKGYSKLLILIPKIVFLNFVPLIPFLGKICLKTSEYFVQNEIQDKRAFRGADFEFDNSFHKVCPRNAFLGQILSQNFKMLCFCALKLGTKQCSRVLISNLTIVFVNSLP